MRTIVLVACSNRKAAAVCAARDLYQGPLFKKTRAFAEAWGWEWFILSALHGVVEPNTPLAPYDFRLRTKAQKQAWADEATVQLRAVTEAGGFQPVRLIVLAGADYTGWLGSVKPTVCDGQAFLALPNSPTPVVIETPLVGLGIGQQMARLTQMTKELSCG